MPQKQVKKHNWDFQRLQTLGKSVPSAFSLLCKPLSRWSIYIRKQRVPFCCNGTTEKCTLHTSIVSCFTLFIQKSRQTWAFYSFLVPQMAKHWSFLCFCFSSLISCLACMFSDWLDQHAGVWRKCYLYRQLAIRKGKRKRKKNASYSASKFWRRLSCRFLAPRVFRDTFLVYGGLSKGPGITVSSE